jgi:N-glycosylase/DNA lyase
MEKLIKEVKELQNSEINNTIEKRLNEFSSFRNKSSDEWFCELCFCILAANSKQKTAEFIEKQLNSKLLTMEQEDLALFIRDSKHRFHNNKAKYIVESRQYRDIKHRIGDMIKKEGEIAAREWLVNNVKGIGYKEASHFLRNTGHNNLAILDRHILNLMHENKIIIKPKTLTKKSYLEIEQKFNQIARQLNISSAKLDLLMWYLKTGYVLK